MSKRLTYANVMSTAAMIVALVSAATSRPVQKRIKRLRKRARKRARRLKGARRPAELSGDGLRAR